MCQNKLFTLSYSVSCLDKGPFEKELSAII